MKVLIIAARLLLIMICCIQFALGMQLSQSYLLELPEELQNKIFSFSDNKTNMQHSNKEWNEKKSIKNPTIFNYVHLTEDKMTCILLSAAYVRNYDGVKNILQNTSILRQSSNRLPFYHMGTCSNGKEAIIDLWGIAEQYKDYALANILKEYNIPAFTPGQTQCFADGLTMMCFTGNHMHYGNSNVCLQKIWKLNKSSLDAENIQFLFNIIVDFDRVQCFKILCNEQNIDARIKCVINRKLLERACLRKRKNILKELLNLNQNNVEFAKIFDLNKIQTRATTDYKVWQKTLLDQVLCEAEKDSDFNEIVTILQENGAIKANIQPYLTASVQEKINTFKEFWYDLLFVSDAKVVYGLGLIFVVGSLYYIF